MNLKEIPSADHSDPLAKRNLERIRLLLSPPPTDLPVALATHLLPPFRLDNDFRPYREFAQRAVSHYLLVDKARPKLELVQLMICHCGLDFQDDLRLIGRVSRNPEWIVTEKVLRSQESQFYTLDRHYAVSKESNAPDTGATDAMMKRDLRPLPWPLCHMIVRATEARILLLNLLEDAVASREWTD